MQTHNWNAFPPNIKKAATILDHARSNNYQIPPLSRSTPGLDQTTGYQIAAAIRGLREGQNGEVVAGRKIGFTNRKIWPEYGIDASNWSYMYGNTIVDLTTSSETLSSEGGTKVVDISRLSNLEPKIEPEIVLGFSRPVSVSMDDAELLSCVEWIAHGFEIVASIYPGWKFTAADTTAAFALHCLLLTGSKVPLDTLSRHGAEQLLDELVDFTIELQQNGKKADDGRGSNVLGSPIKALRHLAELLEKDEFNLPLTAGEVVTTGTLTRALNIRDGEVWSTKISGIELPGLEVKFKLK